MAYYDKDVEQLLSEGLTYDAVAEKLGITFKQVNHSQQRIKKTLEGEEERLPKIEKSNDTYLIKSGSRVISISEAKLKMLKELYCGNKLTINQVCRKLDIPRPNFNVIKTAFQITKSDPPFLDEEFYDNEIDELVSETLEKKKDQYFIKLEQKEITAMKAELHAYRQKDYFIKQMHEAVTQHMTEFARNYKGPTIPAKKNDKGLYLLEPSVVDCHLGKLGWKPESSENYDYKIARERFNYTIDDIYNRALEFPIHRVLYPFGQDFWQIDNRKGQTTAGTFVDSDSRSPKLFLVGLEMHIRAIDLLSTLAPVHVVMVPGNHDDETVFYALLNLSAWYRHSKQVHVWTDFKSRKYVEFGVNLIGYAHGHQEGKRILGNMQVEAPEAWGRTMVREWHVAHKHRYQVQEENGVVVRELSTMTGKDVWEFGKGFVGALSRTQTFLWHKDQGLRSTWETPIWVKNKYNQSVLTI